jgi:phage terminase large subunit
LSILRIKTPKVFAPLLSPSRYKGAHGGRGSGKSHFFAEKLIEDCLEQKGMLALCLREIQKSLAQSSKRLLESKISDLDVGHEFRIWHDRIETPGDGVIVFQGMQDHTAESVKSFEGFRRAWIEEAQAFSTRSLTLLRPTIRADGSELWASWNPRRKSDAVDDFFRGAHPVPGAIVIKANWRDNPWFPATLEAERQIDLARYPDRYDHIWEGEYAKALEGAYFARELAAARAEGRIGNVTRDPLLPMRAVFDLGGASAHADAMAIWICQWLGREIRILDYLEGAGQVLSFYVSELRRRGWGNALCILPHDGMNANAITGKRYEDHLREAGFDVTVIRNQGKGAAMMRVEAARRLFAQIWFDEGATEAGRDALGFYHEKRDETRNVGLGPSHDWSSHAADAFGLMCVAYEEPRKQQQFLDVPAFGAV